MASIELQVSEAVTITRGGVIAYRILINVAEAVNITDKVFVVEKSLRGEDNFIVVASASDLTNIPDFFDPNADSRLYRVSEIELIIDSFELGKEFIESIRRRIRALLISLKNIKEFSQSYSEVINDA